MGKLTKAQRYMLTRLDAGNGISHSAAEVKAGPTGRMLLLLEERGLVRFSIGKCHWRITEAGRSALTREATP